MGTYIKASPRGTPPPVAQIALPASPQHSETVSFSMRPLELAEYHRLIELGFFAPEERLELIQGVLHTMTPKGTRHEAVLSVLATRLTIALADRVWPRVQAPITLPASTSEPEPDLVLAEIRPDCYAREHPQPGQVMLVVEVAESSLEYDRQVKAALYAGADIPEYWIVNLVDNVIEVYHDPAATTAGLGRFRQRIVYAPEESITFMDVVLAVSDVLLS